MSHPLRAPLGEHEGSSAGLWGWQSTGSGVGVAGEGFSVGGK